MSRARPIVGPDGQTHWFDRSLNSHKATSAQLELLADTLGIEIDDLLDEGLSQGQVLERLREANGNVIPFEVLELRRARRAARSVQPVCRICSANGWVCDGRITKHHFVPRWLMRELDHYERYAARSKCTVPACVGRHRDLHYRGEDQERDKSIVPYLTDSERTLAQQMLDDLHEQRPAIFDLIAAGNENSYEYQLVRDYQLGCFREVVEAADRIPVGSPEVPLALDAAAL